MNIPEVVYSQFKTKKQGVIPGFIHGMELKTGSSVALEIEAYTVPQEYDLILTNFVVEANPGGTQDVTAMSVFLVPQPGYYLKMASKRFFGSQLSETFSWSGETWFPEGSLLRVTSEFDAGVSMNQMTFYFIGHLVPSLNV